MAVSMYGAYAALARSNNIRSWNVWLRMFVNHVRRKIDPTAKPKCLLTEPWVGYRFRLSG